MVIIVNFTIVFYEITDNWKALWILIKIICMYIYIYLMGYAFWTFNNSNRRKIIPWTDFIYVHKVWTQKHTTTNLRYNSELN